MEDTTLIKYEAFPPNKLVDREILISEIFRCRVITPKTEFDNGYNQAINEVITRIKHITIGVQND